jgi:hypothetical protein
MPSRIEKIQACRSICSYLHHDAPFASGIHQRYNRCAITFSPHPDSVVLIVYCESRKLVIFIVHAGKLHNLTPLTVFVEREAATRVYNFTFFIAVAAKNQAAIL